jgi:hypothetical protein
LLAAHFSDDPFGTPRATQDKPFYLFNVAAGRFIRSVAVYIIT